MAPHIESMSHYCHLLAQRLGLDRDSVSSSYLASPLHDVGKIAIPDRILLKPGPLDAEEREIVQTHAEIGYRMLAGSGGEMLELAATIAWTHHEHFDGGGYPRGLAGEHIPIEGRIAAVADVFDALTSDRVYRPAFTVDTRSKRCAASRHAVRSRDARCLPGLARRGARGEGPVRDPRLGTAPWVGAAASDERADDRPPRRRSSGHPRRGLEVPRARRNRRRRHVPRTDARRSGRSSRSSRRSHSSTSGCRA